MTKFKAFRTLLWALCAAAGAASAPAVTLDFGTPLAGSGPSASFATLTYNRAAGGSGGDDWSFTLTAGNLSSIFAAPGAFIGSIAVAVPGSAPNYASGLAMSGVTGGVAQVEARNGGGPTAAWDFRFRLGQGSDRLTDGESVSWTWNNSGYQSFDQFALHVQGLEYNTAGHSSSIWYSPMLAAPVPEPGTYGLMLAGLAVTGLALRRRRA